MYCFDSSINFIVKLFNTPINVKPQEGEVGHRVGILTFSFKIIQIPHPWDKIIGQNVHPAASEGGKMSFVRSKSLLLGTSHMIKIPTLGTLQQLLGLSAGTGKYRDFGHLGLAFICSCFVFCLLFLLFYVILISAPVLAEAAQLLPPLRWHFYYFGPRSLR